MSDQLVDSLAKNASQISRLFYVNLTLALLTIYLCLDLIGLRIAPSLASEGGDSIVYEHLESLRPLIDAATLIHRNGNVIREYHEFLKPYTSIESAAEQAIVGVDSSDPAWLSLNADDRDRCREVAGSLLAINFDFLSPEDPNTVSIQYLVENVGKELLVQTVLFSNESAKKITQSCLRVARGLGANVDEPTGWPTSFYFVDFLKRSGGYSELVAAIQKVRENWNEMQSAYSELETICMANDSMMSCSPNEFRSRLEKSDLSIRDTTADDELKIKVSFLPTDVRTTLLLAISPIALMFIMFLFVSLDRRRSALIEMAKHWKVLDLDVVRYPVVPGLVANRNAVQQPYGRFVNIVVWAYLIAGEGFPLAAELSVFWWEVSSEVKSVGWIGLTVLCIGLSAVGYLVLWKHRLGELRLVEVREMAAAEIKEGNDPNLESKGKEFSKDPGEIAEPETGKDG